MDILTNNNNNPYTIVPYFNSFTHLNKILQHQCYSLHCTNTYIYIYIINIYHAHANNTNKLRLTLY